MLKQRESSKTSSSDAEFTKHYEVRGVLQFDGWLPQTVEARDDYVVGLLAKQPVDESSWSVPPHLALANLPTYDAAGQMRMRAALPERTEDIEKVTHEAIKESEERTSQAWRLRVDVKAIEKFVREYGVLHTKDLPNLEPLKSLELKAAIETMDEHADLPDWEAAAPGTVVDEMDFAAAFWLLRRASILQAIAARGTDLAFRERISDFADAQRLLRQAWSGDESVVDMNIGAELNQGFELLAFGIRPKGEVLLATRDLWKLICFLFLLDKKRGKTGVCANPNCPAPYFLKLRRTQKICEQGECVTWAQRKYALGWWNREGKARRTRKRAKASLTKRPAKNRTSRRKTQ